MRVFIGLLLAGIWLACVPSGTAAHAVPERADPPIDGVVPSASGSIEIWFTEEVASDELTVRVIGPRGVRVDNDDAALDLFDPERRRVTLSLQRELAPGEYIVQWHTASAIDQDAADGSFRFSVDPNATPVISPVVSEPTAAPIPTSLPELQTDREGGSTELFGPALLLTAVLIVGVIVVIRRHRREST